MFVVEDTWSGFVSITKTMMTSEIIQALAIQTVPVGVVICIPRCQSITIAMMCDPAIHQTIISKAFLPIRMCARYCVQNTTTAKIPENKTIAECQSTKGTFCFNTADSDSDLRIYSRAYLFKSSQLKYAII